MWRAHDAHDNLLSSTMKSEIRENLRKGVRFKCTLWLIKPEIISKYHHSFGLHNYGASAGYRPRVGLDICQGNFVLGKFGFISFEISINRKYIDIDYVMS